MIGVKTHRKISAPLVALAFVAVASAFSVSVSPAFAEAGCSSCTSSWWHLTSTAAPTYLPPGGEGQLVISSVNLGDGSVDGEATPVTIRDTLPAGLRAVSITGSSEEGRRGPVKCQLGSPLTCTFAGSLEPYGPIEVKITVKVDEGAVSGGLNEVSVSGGQTPSASIARAVTISEEPVPFGLQDDEFVPETAGGHADFQAGSHPFQLTNTLVLNQGLGVNASGAPVFTVPALTKNINVKLPPGLVGNPSPFPRCTMTQFLTYFTGGGEIVDDCPENTAVGIATVRLQEPGFLGLITVTVPVWNLEPGFGEPALFGFYVGEAQVPVLLKPSVRSANGEDYGITVSVPNISQTIAFLSSEVTFWGVPGDPRHDSVRGYGCLHAARGLPSSSLPCDLLNAQSPPSLLTLPTSCTGSPLPSFTEVSSWADPTAFQTFPVSPAMPTLDGCNRLSFSPTTEAEPTTDRASAPSGLDFNLYFHDEGLTSAEGLAQSQLNKTVVTLPEGLTVNPSAGVGLGGCTPADYARESVSSLPGEGCPNDSKLGNVTIETPLLTQKILGSIFIAQPYENPFPEPAAGHPGGTLIALYVVAKNPETGVLVKLAGKVSPNPVTGQLTTTFENNPQLPFDHFNFHFREGQQAPLISPPTCGVYSTQAELTPWSDPLVPLTETSSFTITKGFDGGACPSGGVSPFTPQLQAGTINNNAGAYSPLYVHITRTDAESEISGFSTDMPAGLVGNLTGLPFCPEADIALARTKTGAQEEASPSCPASSEIGHTLVGTGVGAVLAYVPGKLYFAGPYNGDPFSIVSVTSSKVGPFDLGTVVLRFALKIDPYTAKVSVDPTASEPIPTIIDGIVTHVRDIRVYVSRPDFTLNPTSCNPLAVASTLSSNLGQSATITSPFQAASCANLKFEPQESVSTSGKTSKANGASLTFKLVNPSVPQGTLANDAVSKVELPKQLPSRLTTLQKACTAAQFAANPANCPAASKIGYAKVITPILPVPLEGPAIFVSHGGEAFPSLIFVLQGYGVTIDLVGATYISPAGVTSTTLKAVPDAPFTSFELTLPEGPFSALAANGNLCAEQSKLKMPTEFIAQNGVQLHQTAAISVTGCKKVKALTRTQKLAKALKACHKDKNKSKRQKCEQAARKKYGAAKQKGKKK